MALGKSIKMYLTIFIATTCVYMVLYQYHISIRGSISSTDAAKNKHILAEKRYNIFLWPSLSLVTLHSPSASVTPPLSSSSLSSASFTTTMPPPPPPSPSSTLLSSTAIPNTQISSILSSQSSSIPSTTTKSMLVPKKATLTLKANKPNTQISIVPLGYSSLDKISTLKTGKVKNNRSSIRNNINHIINNNNNNENSTISTTTTTSFTAASIPPPLYIITPTYRRPEQLAELVRMGYTLKHVTNLLWLVIEDANKTSPLVFKTLNRIGVPYEYLLAPMPERFQAKKGAKPRGVSNRNRGIEWLRQNASEGAFYFADDDNTYDISIFEQIRYTKKVSMWPVGLVTNLGISSPIVKHGKIIGFYDWIGGRRYPVDMAGFAVGVKFLHQRPKAKMPYSPGYEEDGFLKSLEPFNKTEIELLASGCTEVLVWHTQSKKNPSAAALNMTKYGDTNLASIDKHLVRKVT